MGMSVVACGLLAQCIIANTQLDKVANAFPGLGSRMTTRGSQGLGASICFRRCIFSVIENHPVGGTPNSIAVNKWANIH